MLRQFCTWLANTPPSHFIQDVSWIIPLIQTIHILCVSVVLASVGMLDLRLIGIAGKRVSVAGMSERFLPWIWGAVAILLITGIILIVGEPERDLPNIAFQLKMGLLTAVLLITFFFQRMVRRDANFWNLSPAHRHSAKAMAGTSIALWLAIVTCGRFIAYLGLDR